MTQGEYDTDEASAARARRRRRGAPRAPSAAEVAAVIADVILHPRADAYTRPGARELVAAYYAAEDMAEAEGRPPFMAPPRP